MWLKSDGRFLPSLEVNLMLLFRSKVNWVSEVLTILVRERWSICSNRGDFVTIWRLATEKELYIGKITTLGIFYSQFLEHEVTGGISILLERNAGPLSPAISLKLYTTHLYSWQESGTVGGKGPSKNRIAPARACTFQCANLKAAACHHFWGNNRLTYHTLKMRFRVLFPIGSPSLVSAPLKFFLVNTRLFWVSTLIPISVPTLIWNCH